MMWFFFETEEQEAIDLLLPGWNVSMALPFEAQAEEYRLDLAKLGHLTLPPKQVADGWIVKWRPKK